MTSIISQTQVAPAPVHTGKTCPTCKRAWPTLDFGETSFNEEYIEQLRARGEKRQKTQLSEIEKIRSELYLNTNRRVEKQLMKEAEMRNKIASSYFLDKQAEEENIEHLMEPAELAQARLRIERSYLQDMKEIRHKRKNTTQIKCLQKHFEANPVWNYQKKLQIAE